MSAILSAADHASCATSYQAVACIKATNARVTYKLGAHDRACRLQAESAELSHKARFHLFAALDSAA